MGFKKPAAIIIAGPTASGKSALALALAQAYDGVVINADSIQVYEDLPVLSAQPSPQDQRKVPHKLYGIISGKGFCTAGLWCEQAAQSLKTCSEEKKVPILVGGTGLYLKALTEGLSPIPKISQEIRDKTLQHCHEVGLEQMHQEIAVFDGETSCRLSPHDRQRVMRAWEVYHGTGYPLSYWQKKTKVPYINTYDFITVCLDPPRDVLVERADKRLDQMMAQGALEEVQKLLSQNISRTSSVFKALGAREFARYLSGQCSFDEALLETKKATFSYIKRQQTWFRYQMQTPHRLNDFYSKDTFRYTQSVIKEWQAL